MAITVTPALDPSIPAAAVESLKIASGFDSNQSFNRYCNAAIRAVSIHVPKKDPPESRFAALFGEIESRAADVIPTSWGGVVVTRYEHPEVEKYLVVRAGKYLAFEKHAEKQEALHVEEGAGLLLYRPHGASSFAIKLLLPGDQAQFEPGYEHCLMALHDLVVFERSTDPKGMDKDLIFLFEPE